jgi:hypothetical protein
MTAPFDPDAYSFLRPPVVVADRIGKIVSAVAPLARRMSINRHRQAAQDGVYGMTPETAPIKGSLAAWANSVPPAFIHLTLRGLSITFGDVASWYLPALPTNPVLNVGAVFESLDRDFLRHLVGRPSTDFTIANHLRLTIDRSGSALALLHFNGSGDLPEETQTWVESSRLRAALGPWFIGVESLCLWAVLPAAASAHDVVAIHRACDTPLAQSR